MQGGDRAGSSRLLEIPVHALVILCGGAGSGKSYFAARHFRPTQVVSSDRCRAMVADDESSQAVSGRAFDLFYRIIEHRLALGRLAVADSTALSRDTRRTLRRLAARYGRPAVLIAFDVGVPTCLRNDARRPRRVGGRIIRLHRRRFLRELPRLYHEGYHALYRLRARQLASVRVRLYRAGDAALPAPRPAQDARTGGADLKVHVV